MVKINIDCYNKIRQCDPFNMNWFSLEKKLAIITGQEVDREISKHFLCYWAAQENFKRRIIVHIHTYIIGHYNNLVRIIDLVSHAATYNWFKVDSEQQNFGETFHGNFYLLSEFLPESAERKSPKKYFSYFILMSRILAFRLISQHTTY